MPVYNGEKFVDEAINSVVKQNYPNLEFIIIDGGSSDTTLQLINRYRSSINILISEKDYGLNHAVNKGILLATGEYIGWLNSDDYYFDSALIKIGRYLEENPWIDLLYGDAAHVDENGEFIGWHNAIPFNSEHLVHKRDYIPCQAAFFKKSSISYVGLLDTQLKWCGDWDLWKRFATSGNQKIKFINEKIGAWRLHKNTISSGGGTSRQMYLSALENIQSTRKYSKKLLTKLEIVEFFFLLIGLLHMREFLSKVRSQFLKQWGKK